MLVMTGCLGLTWTASPVAAQSAQNPVTIDVKQFVATSGGTLLIEVTAIKPVKGVLVARRNYPQVTMSTTTLDLPTAGTRKVWLPIQWREGQNTFGSAPEVTFTPTKGDEVTSQVVGELTNLSVGVLPSTLGSRQLPNTSSTITGASTATFAALTVDDLEQRPWILNGFSVVSSTGRELSGASPDAQEHLLRWVRLGGELLIDDDTAVPSLDAASQPAPNSQNVFGDGLIRRTAGAARSGQWDQILIPNGVNELNNDRGPSGWLTNSAVKLPPVGGMLAAMILYTVLAGPVLHTILRRKKRSMSIWTVGPAFAFLTTFVVLGIGLALRSQAQDQFGVMTEYGVGGSTAVLSADTKEGKHTIDLPVGWQVVGAGSQGNVLTRVQRPLKAEVEVPPGGVRLIDAIGPAPKGASPLSGTATSAPDATTGVNVVTVDVKNTSNDTLSNVTAWVVDPNGSLNSFSLGDLAGGRQQQQKLDSSIQAYSPSNSPDLELLLRFIPRNIDTVYLTAKVGRTPSGFPFANGRNLFSAVMVRVPISGNVEIRMPYSNGYNTQGTTTPTAIDLDPKEMSRATVTGDVWVGGAIQTFTAERITESIAPNGRLIVQGSVRISDLTGDSYVGVPAPETTVPLDTFAPVTDTPNSLPPTSPPNQLTQDTTGLETTSLPQTTTIPETTTP